MNFGEQLAIFATGVSSTSGLPSSFVPIYRERHLPISSQQMLLLWERRPFKFYSLQKKLRDNGKGGI